MGKRLISAVEPQKKKNDRYNIYIDGEYAASLGAEACAVFGIKKGEAIDENVLRSAVFEDNTKYAFDSAVSLLAVKMRTRSELFSKLSRKGIDGDAISAAIEKLAGYGYVNDAVYAKEIIRTAIASANYGRKAIAYKLKSSGIDDETIKEALALYTDETEKKIAEKKLKVLWARYKNDRAAKRKMFSHLARHGFDYSIIRTLISEDEEY
ncbi:MAG: RecX family transcriptional regulator [Christensenellales bacterium]|jgi:regulatory protein